MERYLQTMYMCSDCLFFKDLEIGIYGDCESGIEPEKVSPYLKACELFKKMEG